MYVISTKEPEKVNNGGYKMMQKIDTLLDQNIELINNLKNSEYVQLLDTVVDKIVSSLKSGGKILLAGNGGSAADAQHFAGEMVGRFMMERKSLPAISLCVDPSVITCIGNDYGYDEIFSRQLSGLGVEGDCFIAISTSGNSKNLIKAVNVANKKGIKTIGFLGKNGGEIAKLCDYALIVPSDVTPRIQEIHTMTVHIICEQLEKIMFG